MSQCCWWHHGAKSPPLSALGLLKGEGWGGAGRRTGCPCPCWPSQGLAEAAGPALWWQEHRCWEFAQGHGSQMRDANRGEEMQCIRGGCTQRQPSTKAAHPLGYPTGWLCLARSTTGIFPIWWVELFLAFDSLWGKSLKLRCCQASALGACYHKLAGGKTVLWW